ncbi:ERF family protein [Actinomadura litoris]|uniref:ERF family protein n=1 Tax=Actinomadura litoris TaxID=2678616 RepID=UPI001FA7FA7E|nr:ERF family protein [Actinomadura litoris]
MPSLRENAKLMARPDDEADTNVQEPAAPPASAAQPEPLPEVDIPEPPPGGPEQVPVHVAWSRVMGEIREIGKADKVQSGPARFDYRGVDRALNVFGPACRRHGVLVIPTRVQSSYRDTRTSGDKPTRECTVVVSYRIYGPKGDYIEAEAAGESLDTQDKGSAKAQAVALRTLLYHAGLVPTQDTDPDAHSVERGEAPVRSAASYREEILEDGVSLQRCHQIYRELEQHRMLGALVKNGLGEDEPIGELVKRIGTEIRNGNR